MSFELWNTYNAFGLGINRGRTTNKPFALRVILGKGLCSDDSGPLRMAIPKPRYFSSLEGRRKAILAAIKKYGLPDNTVTE